MMPLQGWQARRAPHSRAQPPAGAPSAAAMAAGAPSKEALLQQVAQLVPDLARECASFGRLCFMLASMHATLD